MTMKYIPMIGIVALAVTLGGCHVFKQPKVQAPVAVTETQKAVSAPTLSNLDLRVTAIEKRMDRARAQYAKDRAALIGKLGQ